MSSFTIIKHLRYLTWREKRFTLFHGSVSSCPRMRQLIQCSGLWKEYHVVIWRGYDKPNCSPHKLGKKKQEQEDGTRITLLQEKETPSNLRVS